MAEAELVQTGAPGEHDCQGHQERERREDALGKLGHPENEHDQPVTADQLDQIASGARCADIAKVWHDRKVWHGEQWQGSLLAALVGQPRRLSFPGPDGRVARPTRFP